MTDNQTHAHPELIRDTVCGRRLEVGEILEENDVYSSRSGKWEKCPCPGMAVVDNGVTWIRPA